MTDARPTQSSGATLDATNCAVLVAMIESSPILVAALTAPPAQRAAWAPQGYDTVDIRILEWIASHRRRGHARKTLADLAA